MPNQATPPPDFRGLLWAPSYEQEVVLLFGLLLPYLDEAYAIEECSEAFPDCRLLRSRDSLLLRVEFELYSSRFRDHKHDPSQCDMIVCWKHDWANCPVKNVLVLSRVVEKKKFILDSSRSRHEKTTWDEQSFFDHAGPHPAGFVRQLYDFCKGQSGLTVIFGKGGKLPSFTIGISNVKAPNKSFLGVYANGKAWPGFDEAWPDDMLRGYRKRLARIDRIRDKAMTKEWFEFVVENVTELGILKDTLEWCASLTWE
jgi:hypothetical protein